VGTFQRAEEDAMPRDGHGYEGAVRRFGLSGGQPGLSRADFLKKGSAFTGFLALGGGLAACGGDEEAEDGATAAGEAPAEGTISWLSWPGHNDPSFIRPFTDETGIQVRGKEYSGGDNMLALATTSPSGTYDVVQADAEYIVQLKEAGLLEPLNLDEFAEVNDFFEEFRPGAELVPGLVLDGDVYGLIQRFGFLGLAFNSERIPEADAQSYEILFDPSVESKIGWFDWWAHMGPISLYEGAKGGWWPPGELDPYDISEEQFSTMTETVFSLKPKTAGFYAIGDLFGAFANEEIWIQPAGGGWTALLLEAEGHPIKASVPQEGAIQWTECLGLFKDAKNPDAAKEFIRYALGPRGQVQTAILPAYQAEIPNRAGWELMNEEEPDWAERLDLQLDGPNIMDLYEEGRISIRKLPVQQTIEEWNDAWTEFKAL
jgi:spermidine/putrescine transport system substrate-binding protein